jgi:chromosome segregation ATPase
VTWLKVQLKEAWDSELSFKKHLRDIFNQKIMLIIERTEQTQKQFGQLSQQLEMWQMRNEELETHLLTWQQRCWSLKHTVKEHQHLITALT